GKNLSVPDKKFLQDSLIGLIRCGKPIVCQMARQLPNQRTKFLSRLLVVVKPNDYKSYCTHCGQKNYQAIPEGQIGTCGRCDAKARVNFKQTHMQVFTWPGKSVDEYEDFTDWTLSEIRQRVELVQDFDRLCSDIVSAYCETCRNYRVTEEEILVPKTIKVLEPV
ncbi:MAG: hypothetical protein ABIG61_12505, partial [Planctomycetota bacterium]